MTTEKIEVGQEYMFSEDGMFCMVEILEDKSNDKYHEFNVEVKRIIESGMFKDPDIGDRHTITKAKEMGGGCSGLWFLREPPPSGRPII